MQTGYERQCGGGRGRKTSTAGMARDCAHSVLLAYGQGGVNVKYNMALFGAAMRRHMEDIRVNGGSVRPEIQALVNRAETVLKVECDGRDCEFQKVG